MEMKKEKLIEILEKNKDDIEVGDWENVYTNIVCLDRGQFTDFLIENGFNPSTLFNDYIPEYAFCDSKLLTSINIRNSITQIGNSAFSGCSSLTSLTIPNSITKIENYAFYKCTSLESITLPNSLKWIGGYVFEGCSSLTSITIPNSVKVIGDRAFAACKLLKEIKYDGTEEEWNKVELFRDSFNTWIAKVTFLK